MHRLVLAEHVEALVGTGSKPTQDALDGLERAGLLMRVRLSVRDRGCYLITRTGLDAIESDLPVTPLDLGRYRHDVGVVWVWLTAFAGQLGEVRFVLSEREMRARDESGSAAGGSGTRATSRYGMRVSGVSGLRYPDVLLATEGGSVAIHLQVGFVGERQVIATLTAYGSDPRFIGVLYLVEDPRTGRMVESAAAGLGLADMTRWQQATFG